MDAWSATFIGGSAITTVIDAIRSSMQSKALHRASSSHPAPAGADNNPDQNRTPSGRRRFRTNSFYVAILFLFCAFVLFFQLGAAALFEPTEGRNAEIGREILLTHD